MILVTGGAGYIGSHFVHLARACGEACVVLDNCSRSDPRFIPKDIFVQGDVADARLLADLCREHAIDAVVHFAALAYVGESMSEPARYYGNNVVATWYLLESLRGAGVRHFVFSSSCATFGMPPKSVRISESMTQAPINPYGQTKLTVERMLRDYERAYGLRYASLRYFNAAGCSERFDLYEAHDPETHLLPLAVAAASGGPQLAVFGSEHETPDGTCIRDYIHVDDLARAHLAAIKLLRAGASNLELNLGIGRGYSVREAIAAVERILGRKVPVEYSAARPGDPPALVADPSRARDVLGWLPEYGELDPIVRTACLGYQRKVNAERAVRSASS